MRAPDSITCIRRVTHSTVLLLSLIPALAFPLSPAVAQERRASFTVSPYAFEKLDQAQQLLGEEKYDEARQVLRKLLERKGLSDHEKALALQILGYVAAGEERYDEAARFFEQCLELSALPEEAMRDLRYNLAQLYVALERYSEAATLLAEWVAAVETPPASAYYLLAVARAQAGDRRGALEPAREAVRRADKPREPWLQLLVSLLLEEKRYKESIPVLQQLIEQFPKRVYFQQLSAVHAELGREDKAFAVLQLAHLRGLLDADREVRNLVRMYLYHEIPFHGGRILQRALERGVVATDADAWELLADCWLRAREWDQALPALERAAALSPKGELFLRLARIHAERERWPRAARAAEQALKRGGLRDPGQAYLLLGIARAALEQLDAAEDALHRAQRFDSSRESARAWLRHVESQRRLAGRPTPEPSP